MRTHRLKFNVKFEEDGPAFLKRLLILEEGSSFENDDHRFAYWWEGFRYQSRDEILTDIKSRVESGNFKMRASYRALGMLAICVKDEKLPFPKWQEALQYLSSLGIAILEEMAKQEGIAKVT